MKRETKGTSPRPVLERRLQKIGSYEKAARHLSSEGLEVSSSYLNMIVRGSRDPSLRMARRIAEALGLRLSDVTGA